MAAITESSLVPQQIATNQPREQRMIGRNTTAEAAAAIANARKAQNSEYGLLSLKGNFQRFFDPILFDQQVNLLHKFMEANNVSVVTPELAKAVLQKRGERGAAMEHALYAAQQTTNTHEATLRDLADTGILSEGKIINLNTPVNKSFQDEIIQSIVAKRSENGKLASFLTSVPVGKGVDSYLIRHKLSSLAREPQFANTEVGRFIQNASRDQIRIIVQDLKRTAREVRQIEGNHAARLQNIDLAFTNMVAGDKRLEAYFKTNRIYIVARYARLVGAGVAIVGIAHNPFVLLPAAGALAITAGISYWSKHRTNVVERELYQRGLANPKGQNFEPPKWSQMNTGQRAAKVVGEAVKPLFGGVEVSKAKYNYDQVLGQELLEGTESGQKISLGELANRIRSAQTETERNQAVNDAIARMAEIDTRIDFSVDQNVHTIDYGRFGRRDFLVNYLQQRASLQDAILSGLQAGSNRDNARVTLKHRLDQQATDVANKIIDDQVAKDKAFKIADIATSGRAAVMSAALSFAGGHLVKGAIEHASSHTGVSESIHPSSSASSSAPELTNMRPATAGVSDFTGKPFEDAGKDLLHVVQDVGRSTQKGFADIQHDWNTQNAGKFYQDVATQPLRPLQGLGGLNQVGEDVANGVAVNAGEAIQGGIDNAKNLGSTIGTDWNQFWSNVGKDIGGLQTVVEHNGSHGGGIDYGQHAEDIPVLKGDVSLPSGDHFVFDPTHHSIDIVDAKNQILATDVHIDSASHHLIGLDLEGHKILDLPTAKSVMEFAQSTKINYLPDTLPHHDWQQLHAFVRHDGGSNYIHVDYTAHDGPKGFTSLETPNGEHIFIKGPFNLASSGPHAGDIVHLVKFDPATHKVVDIGTMQSSELAHQLGLTQTRINNYTEIINKAHGGLWHGTQDAADLQVIMAQRGILSNANHGQALFGMRMGGGYFNKDGVFQIGASNHTFDHSLIKGPTGHSYVISEGQLKPLGPFGSEPGTTGAGSEGYTGIANVGDEITDKFWNGVQWLQDHPRVAASIASGLLYHRIANRPNWGRFNPNGNKRDAVYHIGGLGVADLAALGLAGPGGAIGFAAGYAAPYLIRGGRNLVRGVVGRGGGINQNQQNPNQQQGQPVQSQTVVQPQQQQGQPVQPQQNPQQGPGQGNNPLTQQQAVIAGTPTTVLPQIPGQPLTPGQIAAQPTTPLIPPAGGPQGIIQAPFNGGVNVRQTSPLGQAVGDPQLEAQMRATITDVQPLTAIQAVVAANPATPANPQSYANAISASLNGAVLPQDVHQAFLYYADKLPAPANNINSPQFLVAINAVIQTIQTKIQAGQHVTYAYILITLANALGVTP